jgi:hypothetical protein
MAIMAASGLVMSAGHSLSEVNAPDSNSPLAMESGQVKIIVAGMVIPVILLTIS